MVAQPPSGQVGIKLAQAETFRMRFSLYENKSMPKRPDTLYQEILRLHSGILPVGWLLQLLSKTSVDEKTQSSLQEAHKALDTSGLLVLDAHQNRLDIFASGIAVAKTLHPLHLTAPAAGMYTHNPLMRKLLFDPIEEQMSSLSVFPVYRAEERGTTDRKIHDQSGLSASEKRRANHKYLTQSVESIQKPGHIAVVAPYGSRKTFGTEIRAGILPLLYTESPVLLSAAHFDWRAMAYVVQTSQLLRFTSEMETPDINSILKKTFLEIIR